MASRLQLVHLTVVGKGLIPASIEFGDRLTVIHGASDTGKSHVFDLIRYAFGLAKTIDIPDEGKRYQYVHLGLAIDGGSVFTLIRDFEGGAIGLVESDVRELTGEPASEYLDPRHVSKDPNSISRRLLSLTDLDELQVRKNQYNETRMLEWRDVVRLVAVDEETIIAKRSPIEFGQYQHRPVEAAIFKLFIQGDDDSGLLPIPKAAELKKISANKVEILDQIIANLERELTDSPPVDQLREQLARLNSSLAAASEALDEVSAMRDELVVQRSANANALAELRERHDEIASLGSRFGLLRAQYDSDLSRLEMLAQVADVLSVSEQEDCSFCGARAEHQHWHEPMSDEVHSATFAVAVASEQSKVLALRADLDQAISAIQAERGEIEERVHSILARNSEITAEVRRFDKEIRTPVGTLTPLMETRSYVERQINTHSRLMDLLTMRASAARVEKPKTSTEVPILASDLRQFDSVAEEILRQWSFPSGSSVHYSVNERDLVVDQRPRQTHGKGVRSILHALFNVALADYCVRRDYWHPGFVILDSPIVSYRQAGDPELAGEEETIGANVVDAFYAYLQNGFHGQSVVLENKSPVSPLPEGSREYFFGGPIADVERAGFYPATRRQ